MATDSAQIGRAATVLVLGSGASGTAILSSVVAQPVQRGTDVHGIHFVGPTRIVLQAQQHLQEVVAVLVERILMGLGLEHSGAALSIANVGAAAIHDITLEVAGGSADLPIFLALLSLALRLPIPSDVVSTGHIGSTDGQVLAVRDLPAKLEAASMDRNARRFLHPAMDGDGSLRMLAPSEHDRALAAVVEHGSRLQLIAVADIAEAMHTVLGERDIVLASLRAGYFGREVESDPDKGPITQAIRYLSCDLEQRLWGVLRHEMMGGNRRGAKELLAAWSRHFIRHRRYPEEAGRRLWDILCGLPAATRNIKLAQPLLSIGVCIRLAQFAGTTDHADVELLFRAIGTRRIIAPVPARPLGAANTELPDCASVSAVEAAMSEITPETLAAQIGIPIDTARAGYAVPAVTVETFDDFIAITSGLTLALYRSVSDVRQPAPSEAIHAETIDLVEAAFGREGGLKAAVAEAKDAPRGGLRYVMDVMTLEYKHAQQAKHARRVFREALNPLDWPARRAFTQALLQRLRPHLPRELADQPAERFAEHCEAICQAYVRSLDQVKSLLRTL